MAKHLAILKIHSHPTHYADFSETDDFSDQELFSSLHGWTDDGLPHASAIMMEGGDMIARFITSALEFNSAVRLIQLQVITSSSSTLKTWLRKLTKRNCAPLKPLVIRLCSSSVSFRWCRRLFWHW